MSRSRCSPKLGSNSLYVNSLHEVTEQHLSRDLCGTYESQGLGERWFVFLCLFKH